MVRPRQRMIAGAVISLFIILRLLSWRTVSASFLKVLSIETQQTVQPQQISEAPLAKVPLEFVQRPLPSYDDAVSLNSASCPTEGVNFDEGSVRENEETWRGIPSSMIFDWRHDIAEHLQKKMDSEASTPVKRMGGRGIVMSAGDGDAVVRVRTSECLPAYIHQYMVTQDIVTAWLRSGETKFSICRNSSFNNSNRARTDSCGSRYSLLEIIWLHTPSRNIPLPGRALSHTKKHAFRPPRTQIFR